MLGSAALAPLAVVGLGNPGPRYASTRHNIGFMVLDELSNQLGVSFDVHQRWNAHLARSSVQGRVVWLLKPQSFMNLSGPVASALCRFHRIAPTQCLVIHDDVDLPLGRLRLRLAGSSGGHNGVSSIIEAMGTSEFPRIRVGISGLSGRPAGSRLAGAVLEPFAPGEEPLVAAAVQRATKAAIKALHFGLNAAMNEFNKSPDL